MLQIIEHPGTKELYAYSEQFNQISNFSGTPFTAPKNVGEWRKVGTAKNLSEWQAEPGKCGTLYGLHHIYCPDKDDLFLAGGSIAYIKEWCSENHTTIMGATAHAYSDRNVARDTAERNGGVAW